MNKSKSTRASSSLPINRINRKALLSGGKSREYILENYNQDLLNKAWNSLCSFIAQNYESGRGTVIKNFGTFTYISSEVNLEGTTNQYQRDKKAKRPVFIVSKEFNENLRPGQYNINSGHLIYFTQKQNNSLTHVRLNYAEIAYSLGIKKEECESIIQNLIFYIDNNIRSKIFKSKEMPNIGTLILQGNILGVKFNNEFSKLSNIPQQRLRTKKDIELYMQPEENKVVSYNDIKDVKKAMKNLQSKNSVNTKITGDANNWLKNNLGFDLDEIMPADESKPFEEQKNIMENNFINENKKLNFINDKPKKKQKSKKLNLIDLNIPYDILQAIEFHKSLIIREMKNFDKKMTGIISRNDCVKSFIKANIHYSLNNQIANEICKVYSTNPDNVDYMKLMTMLLRDIKKINGSSNFNDVYNSNTNSFINKNKNKLRPMSARSIPDGYEIKRKGNKNINQQSNDLSNVVTEMKSIKLILNNLIEKYKTKIDQLISLEELCRKLRDYDIVYPKRKIMEILQYISINNIYSFSLREFRDKMAKCKIISTELRTKEILTELKKLKDIIYTMGGDKFLFEGKNTITKDEFINKIVENTNYDYETINNIYIY